MPEERKKLLLPQPGARVLLHSCCAPCSGEVIEALHESDIDFAVYFYNPNIHPQEEYEKRKAENARFASKLGVPFIDADYDPDRWFERVEGLEQEPERGKRCTQCFGMRLERSALYAHEHGFLILTSSFGISRWKDMAQVNACGHLAAARYDDVNYWDYNWRKDGGAERMVNITSREGFYRQDYCGCTYSLRDANKRKYQKLQKV
jgi:predicted adenine nucleotide alpha hydrolase (AANH) superfamily ATPase